MQRTENDGIVISCDFCGVDWDPQTGLPPMTEGHHGSVLCLECLKLALERMAAQPGPYACTLCLRDSLPASLPAYRSPKRAAVVCQDCIEQAAKVFSRDPDVNWSRPKT